MPDGTVLFRKGSLGDVVLLGAVTAVVPRPVTIVTAKPWMEVASSLRGVTRVVDWEDTPTHAALRGARFDLQGSLGSRSVAGPVDGRIDKHSIRRRLRLWWGAAPRRPTVPELYGAACGVVPVRPPWIDVPRAERDALVLGPAASCAPKRWPPERLAELGRAFSGPVVVLGGPDDGALVEAVAGAIPGAAAVAERGFTQTLSWLSRAKVAVTADSGLMHLAGAVGVPVLALFGPTHPDDGFWVYRGEVLQRDLACRPCALHRVTSCPLGDQQCTDVSAGAAAAALARVCAGSS